MLTFEEYWVSWIPSNPGAQRSSFSYSSPVPRADPSFCLCIGFSTCFSSGMREALQSTLHHLDTYTNKITVRSSSKCRAPWTIWENVTHLIDATVHSNGDLLQEAEPRCCFSLWTQV